MFSDQAKYQPARNLLKLWAVDDGNFLRSVKDEEYFITFTDNTLTLPEQRYVCSSNDAVVFGNKLIINEHRPKQLFSLNAQREKTGRQTSSNNSFGRGFTADTQLCGELVIINMAHRNDYDEVAPMDIAAFKAASGERVWQLTLPYRARASQVFAEKLYIIAEQGLTLLDANTGEQLWEMPPFWHDEEIGDTKAQSDTWATQSQRVPCLFYPLNEQYALLNFLFEGRCCIIDMETKALV